MGTCLSSNTMLYLCTLSGVAMKALHVGNDGMIDKVSSLPLSENSPRKPPMPALCLSCLHL